LDLPSHLAFGWAVGFVFFGSNPEIALLIGLGTLVPDLDREYWYVRQQVLPMSSIIGPGFTTSS